MIGDVLGSLFCSFGEVLDDFLGILISEEKEEK